MQQYIAPFIRTQKLEQLLMKATLMMYLVQIYQRYKYLVEKAQVGLLIQL